MFAKSIFKAFAYLASITLFCHGDTNKMARVSGGTNAHQKDWYFMVSLYTKSKVDQKYLPFVKTNTFLASCGGVILTKWHIMTAAHCLYERKPRDIVLVVGSTRIKRTLKMRNVKNSSLKMGGQKRFVQSLKLHQNYSTVKITNDIGIIKVTEPFIFDYKKIGPISIEAADQVPEGKIFQ